MLLFGTLRSGHALYVTPGLSVSAHKKSKENSPLQTEYVPFGEHGQPFPVSFADSAREFLA